MFSFRRPSPAELAQVAGRQANCELTYSEHGATRGSLPAGYHHDVWEADLGGFDETTFDRLGAALCDWRGQRGAGLSQGEEAFHVVRDGSQMVLRITAFSRPHHPLARIGAPVSRVIQVRMNQAYLRAMRVATANLAP
jgi:uncharacterized protein (UPF0548 family)